MSQIQLGIVGLPNVGKSTVFNALLKKQQAYVANFPFATIEPNIGVVPVPDERLTKLTDVVSEGWIVDGEHKRPPEVPATDEFLDIAGLIAGAHMGEGLGNKFLSHIREVNAICHVVRAFSDPEIIKQGVNDPKTDLEVVETELKLADLQTLEKQPDFAKASTGKKDPSDQAIQMAKVVIKLKDAIEKGLPARELELNEEEKKYSKQLSLFTSKPILVVFQT